MRVDVAEKSAKGRTQHEADAESSADHTEGGGTRRGGHVSGSGWANMNPSRGQKSTLDPGGAEGAVEALLSASSQAADSRGKVAHRGARLQLRALAFRADYGYVG